MVAGPPPAAATFPNSLKGVWASYVAAKDRLTAVLVALADVGSAVNALGATPNLSDATSTGSALALLDQALAGQDRVYAAYDAYLAQQRAAFDAAGAYMKGVWLTSSWDSQAAFAVQSLPAEVGGLTPARGQLNKFNLALANYDAGATWMVANDTFAVTAAEETHSALEKAQLAAGATAYDALDRKTSVTQPDPDGAGPLAAPVTRYGYDADGNVVSVTDPRGGVTTTAYDRAGRKTSVTQPDPDGAGPLAAPVTTYAYDASGNLTGQTDPLGHTTNFVYDALNRRTETDQPSPDGAAPRPVTTTGYDLAGHAAAWTDARGFTTNSFYDGLGRKVETDQPSPDGAAPRPVTTYGYDPAGNLLATTDPMGDTTNYAYDGLNRKAETDQPSPDGAHRPATIYAYDADGNLVGTTDPRGFTTSNIYDGLNRKVETDQPSPDGVAPRPTTTYAYDAAGNLTAVTDPRGFTTNYVYDGLNRKTETDQPSPDGTAPRPVTTVAYDPAGDPTAVTDPLGHTTTTAYDLLGRKTRVLQPSPDGVRPRPATTYAYDAAGNELSVTDAAGNATVYAYDALNRQTTDTNALGQADTTAYDPAGNVTKDTDRDGRVRTFSYDALNRKTAEHWLDASGNVTRTTAWSFDAAGRVTRVTDPDSTTGYTYDHLGRVLTTDTAGSGGSPDVVLTAGYDPAGNQTSFAAAVGGAADFSDASIYDALGRLTSVARSGTGVSSARVDFGYDAAGDTVSVSRYADTAGVFLVASSASTYDHDGRLTALTHTPAAGSPLAYTWALDAAGRVAGSTDPDGSSTYSYDADNQLLSATNTAKPNESYAYDLNGNRTGANGASGFTTGADNRLASDATYTYAYDGEGNRTLRTTTATGETAAYAWDDRNRLTGVTFKDGLGHARQAGGLHLRRQRPADQPPGDRRIGGGDAGPQIHRTTGRNCSWWWTPPGPSPTGSCRLTANSGLTRTPRPPGSPAGAVVSGRRPADRAGRGRRRGGSPGPPRVRQLRERAERDQRRVTRPGSGTRARCRDLESGLDYYNARYYDPRPGPSSARTPRGLRRATPTCTGTSATAPLDGTDPTGMDDQSGDGGSADTGGGDYSSGDSTSTGGDISTDGSDSTGGSSGSGDGGGDGPYDIPGTDYQRFLAGSGWGTGPDGNKSGGPLVDQNGEPIQLASTDPNAAAAAVRSKLDGDLAQLPALDADPKVEAAFRDRVAQAMAQGVGAGTRTWLKASCSACGRTSARTTATPAARASRSARCRRIQSTGWRSRSPPARTSRRTGSTSESG